MAGSSRASRAGVPDVRGTTDARRATCSLGRLLLLAAAVAALAGCAAPQPTASPLRLPTRVPVSPAPTAIDILARYQAGVAHRAAGDTAAAMDALSQTLALDPTFAAAYVQRGALYLAEGEIAAALADAQAAVAADPEDAVAHFLLGEVLRLGYNAPQQALEAYDRAVQLDPALSEPSFQARWLAAVAAGQASHMVGLANEYADARPDDPLAALYRGRALTALGTPSAAVRTLVAALEDGGPAALWFALGDAYAATGAWSYALVCYEQARTLWEMGDRSLGLVSDTAIADLAVGLGAAYLYTGECTSARLMLEHALALGLDQPEAHTLLGQAMICLTPTPTPTPFPWLGS